MYGLPPIICAGPHQLIGINYSYLFASCSGDAGQGLLRTAFRWDTCCTVSCRCGWQHHICAVCFPLYSGFLVGSIFGFEDIIERCLAKPQRSHGGPLPYICRMNTVGFVVAVAIRQGDHHRWVWCSTSSTRVRSHVTETIYFDTYGVAGFVFYLALYAVLASFI